MTNLRAKFGRCFTVVATMVTFMFASSSTAYAGDEAEGDWYGWQLMAVDAASIAMLTLGPSVAADESEEQAAVITGLAGYALGAPAVHLAHQDDWTSLESVGLRVGLPLAGFLGGGLVGIVADDSSGYGAMFGALFGLAVGVVSAMVIDYTVLAHHPEPQSTISASQTRMLQLQWHF